MSSEPRSKNYPHVYQRSLDAVKDTPGEPVLWQVMRALALDPLEAQDAKDEQQWPSSDFADFCAHPDKMRARPRSRRLPHGFVGNR